MESLAQFLVPLLFIYLVWAILWNSFFHQVLAFSVLLLTFLIYYLPLTTATYVLAIPTAAFCVALLPPVQRIFFTLDLSHREDLEILFKPTASNGDEDSKRSICAESALPCLLFVGLFC